MPFDTAQYDGIFCFALIQLLNTDERIKFIKDCYDQLSPNGHMLFTVPSKESVLYRKGNLIGKDRYKLADGLNVYFYDSQSISHEYKNFGLIDYMEIDEPPLKCILIRCQKNN